MDTGIDFNGKHSYRDFGLTVQRRYIGYPSKIKITERVPGSNRIYDFSSLYGGQQYEERPLSYTFNIITSKRKNFLAYESEVINWLFGPNEKIVLKDDLIPGYYFLAEAVTESDGDYTLFFAGEVTINFTAYPLKISELEEGHDIWDEFNFLTDYAQITEFVVSGSSDIVLYNPGIDSSFPVIESTGAMEITKNNVIYSIPAGTSESLDFPLTPGENELKITGNGTISFRFRKEIL